jgi:hypothetical protein
MAHLVDAREMSQELDDLRAVEQMWRRGGVRGGCTSWGGSGCRWWCKGGVLIGGSGGHYYRDMWAFVLRVVLSGRSEPLETVGRRVEWSGRRPLSVLLVGSEVLVVERGQGEGILDCKSAWGSVRRDRGITGVRA